jgi:hypothetical protein
MEARAADDAFKLGKKTVQDKVNEEASIVKRGREALSTLIKNVMRLCLRKESKLNLLYDFSCAR